MEVRHLRLVVEVARLGSLTKASKTLFLTQSALSHQLKKIEKELGIRVFKRINNRMVLTVEGKIVHKYAEKALENLDRIHHEIEKLKN